VNLMVCALLGVGEEGKREKGEEVGFVGVADLGMAAEGGDGCRILGGCGEEGEDVGGGRKKGKVGQRIRRKAGGGWTMR